MANSKFNDWNTADKLKLIAAWCRDGLTNEQIANNIGVTRNTFQRWLAENEEFREHVKKSKTIVDIEVENALLKRALGYKYDEITKERTENGLVVTKVITKEVQPDTTAQIFWLKNRKPEIWRDRKVIDAEMKQETKIDLSNLSDEEIEKILKNDK